MAFIIRQKNNRGGIDLYYATNHRVQGKKHPVQSRKYLGKLNGGNEIRKNRKLSNFTQEELKALNKSGISYNGLECPPPGRNPSKPKKVGKSAMRQWHTLEYGRVAVLRMFAEKSGLLNALQAAFGKDEGLQIFAAAVFECVESSALYRSESWIEETVLSQERFSFSKSTIDRLVSEIGSDESARSYFFKEWIKECKHPKVLIHDTTSISSYAEKISMIEYGYNRDRERLPQLNFALVYTAKEQLPLMFRAIPGSIPDVSTLCMTSNLLREYGLEDFSYSLDRGYYSNANLLEMLEKKIRFTIGAPLFPSAIATPLKKHRKNLEKIENGLLVGDQPYRHIQDVFQAKGKGKRGRSRKLGLHFFINTQKRASMIQELDSLLLSLQKQFQKENFSSRADALEWCELNFTKTGSLYVLTGQRPNTFKLSICENAYAEKIRNFGVFAVLNSDAKTDGITTLYSNRQRDAVEKIFDTMKNSTPNKRLRVASDTKAHGKLFLAFISVILYTSMENLLRKQDILNKVTVNQAFDLLRKIRIGINSEGQKTLLEIPRKTRKLLEDLDITLPKM